MVMFHCYVSLLEGISAICGECNWGRTRQNRLGSFELSIAKARYDLSSTGPKMNEYCACHETFICAKFVCIDYYICMYIIYIFIYTQYLYHSYIMYMYIYIYDFFHQHYLPAFRPVYGFNPITSHLHTTSPPPAWQVLVNDWELLIAG